MTPTVPTIYWEDFAEGNVAECGPRLITAEEIIAFAAEFDPQPMHLSDEGARRAGLDGLIASGWHTCAITMRLMVDGFVGRSSSMGAPAVDEVKWLAPVRPDDHLTLRYTVLETRSSKTRPDMGIVRTLVETMNQSGAVVLTMTTSLMFGRRGVAAPSD